MELRQLKYFIAVAEELHFGRAAKRVHISQPPLSMQIKNLEAELGVRLFQRSSRQVALTEAGAQFLEDVRGILARIDGAVARVREMGRGKAGRLAIGFVGPAMDAFLPEALHEFRSRYPEVVLSLSELTTHAQLAALGDGRLHAGILRLCGHELGGLSAERLLRQPYVLALPADHPLTRKRRVPLAALKGEPLIFYPRRIQPVLYDRMMARFASAGFTPRIIQEAETKRTTISLVAAGIGVALVPDASTAHGHKGVVFRPVSGRLPAVEIFVVWDSKRSSPTLERFLGMLRMCKAGLG